MSPRIANKAVTVVIGKMKAISPLKVQVAFKKGTNAEKFTFSGFICIPRLAMHLSAGALALLNVNFLVGDAYLADEDVLWKPLFQHLGIDSNTMLERYRHNLDGTDCASIPDSPSSASVVFYWPAYIVSPVQYRHRQPFQDIDPIITLTCMKRILFHISPSLVLVTVTQHLGHEKNDVSQDQDISEALEATLYDALDHGFPTEQYGTLPNILLERKNTFRTSSAAWGTATVM